MRVANRSRRPPTLVLIIAVALMLVSFLAVGADVSSAAVPAYVYSVSPVEGPVGSWVTVVWLGIGWKDKPHSILFNGTPAKDVEWDNIIMYARVPKGATSGPVSIVIDGTPSFGDPAFTVLPAKIIDCTPNDAVQGARDADIIITGEFTNFQGGASGAVFSGDGIAVKSTKVITPTQAVARIDVDVTASPTTRDVNVITGDETPQALVGHFTVQPREARPPGLDGISPTSGIVGTPVTFTGRNFYNTQGSSNVTFNGTPATEYVSWTDKAIVAKVPAGASSGPAKVTTLDGTSGGESFVVTEQGIGACSPFIEYRGDTINLQIVGSYTHFKDGSSQATVSGDGVTVNSTTVTDELHAVANITAGPAASEGARDVNVITTSETPNPLVGGLVVLQTPTDPPVITGMDPVSGPIGTHLTINGRNFGVAQGSSRVSFNGAPATSFSAWSDDAIVCHVPEEATTGPVQVNTQWGTSNVTDFTIANPTFYFAEGTCRPGFVPYLCISNPEATDAKVKTTYMLGNGATLERVLGVAAHSRYTVAVKDVLGEGNSAAYDFSAKVESVTGQQIVAERPMYFNYNGACPGGTDVVGAHDPGTLLYFAEGTCRPGYDPYLCLQNPGDIKAEVKITYMTGTGVNKEQALTVAPHSRSTVSVTQVLGVGDDWAHDFSTRVESDQEIVAERSIYYFGTDMGGQEGVGEQLDNETNTYYFAEGTCRPGYQPYICIQNPSATDANVLIEYVLGDGGAREQSVMVPAHSRYTVSVTDFLGVGDDAAHDFSAEVKCLSGVDIVCERPMYFTRKADRGPGWTGVTNAFAEFASAEQFYFAEGTCRPDFDPYITVLNPEMAPAAVNITYMLGDGSTREQAITVPPRTRSTVTVKDILGQGDDAVHDFATKVESTNGVNIVCERPMYFNYRGVWPGGFDVAGFSN